MHRSFPPLTFLVLAAGILFSLGCPFGKKGDSSAKTPPASVANAVRETALTTVTLSESAVHRLGVEVAPVIEKTVQRTRVFGGEIMVPSGQSVVVAAPWGGTLSPGNPDKPLAPGMAVRQGETVLMIQPVFSAEVQSIQLPQMLLDARQGVQAAQIECDAANIELQRATQLLKDRAGSRQEADKAEAKVQLARQALESAKSNLALLEASGGREQGAGGRDENPPQLATRNSQLLPIVAPVSGILNHFTSVAGQTVVQGSVLFDIVNTELFWVRVPVYVGQLRDVDLQGETVVHEYGRTDRDGGVIAVPVIAPPSANPNAATVDLYYALQSPESWVRPGHKVAVQLPIAGEETRLTVPWSSVIFDIYGGSWVYCQTDEQTGTPVKQQSYTRQRVEVEYVRDTDDGSMAGPEYRHEAVLRRGPPPGTPVVVTGAAEIFGTEFGGAK